MFPPQRSELSNNVNTILDLVSANTDRVRVVEASLAKAIAKIALNQKLLSEVKQQIEQYNQAVNGLNNCLQSLNLSEYQLPAIEQQEITSELVENNNHYQSDALIAIE